MASYTMAYEIAKYHAARRVIIRMHHQGLWCYIKADLYIRFAWRGFAFAYDMMLALMRYPSVVNDICHNLVTRYIEVNRRRLMNTNKRVNIFYTREASVQCSNMNWHCKIRKIRTLETSIGKLFQKSCGYSPAVWVIVVFETHSRKCAELCMFSGSLEVLTFAHTRQGYFTESRNFMLAHIPITQH